MLTVASERIQCPCNDTGGLHDLRNKAKPVIAEASWIARNSWIYAIAIAVVGLAVGIWFNAHVRRGSRSQNAPTAIKSGPAQELWRRKLLIGDAKVSVVLAIQRHTDDDSYRGILERDPSFIELSPYLSAKFAEMMAAHATDTAVWSARTPPTSLAVAYRKEIERLEMEWGTRA
jgi:hypothetical protein